jgi:hypothetical protein
MSEEHVPAADFSTPREQLLGRFYDQQGRIIAYHESRETVSPA